jgi:hypothetical protein
MSSQLLLRLIAQAAPALNSFWGRRGRIGRWIVSLRLEIGLLLCLRDKVDIDDPGFEGAW